MFSPDATLHSVHAPGSRNPRRRQRNDSDSAKQTPRKRSKLSGDTFLDPSAAPVNGNGSAGANGHAANGTGHRTSSLKLEIPVREKKHSAAGARPTKGDASVTLTKTANYTVRLLPGLPEALRANPKESYRAFVHPSRSNTVAFTHDHAFLWDYASPISTPSSHTLRLPFTLQRSDPLPVGGVVSTGSSNELGLLVVHPTSGKITFWENVDTAESSTYFQERRQGVEGAVGSMLSGEHVTDIVDAEHAGFVLIFSTGRVAQLTVRDSQGRPQISVQFLRNQNKSASGSFLGGLRSVFSGSGWNKDVASVKVRPSDTKGQLEVVIATGSGSFQLWDLSWAGQNSLKSEISVQEEILKTLYGEGAPEMASQGTGVRIIDFAILQAPKTHGTELSVSGKETAVGVLALVAVIGSDGFTYALVDIQLLGDAANVDRVIPIDVYHGLQQTPEHAKLLIPAPGHTAFAIFPQAIVITALAQKKESPNDQLLVDSGVPPKPLQDVIYTRKDKHLRFAGYTSAAPERRTKHSNCILFTEGAGVLRLTAFEPRSDGKDVERTRVSAKSRITQAVFYGSSHDSIFDFSAKTEFTYPEDEIVDAAFALSQEILTSASEHVPILTSSQSQQLAMRAKALADLATHLRKNYPPLPRVAKWRLLSDAEKMTAAQGLWEHYEERSRNDSIRQRPLMGEIVSVINERYKSELRPELGELDEVRQWFTKDVSRLEVAIPFAYIIFKECFNHKPEDHVPLMILATEADDIFLNSVGKAYKFRGESLERYGLDEDDFDLNVLKTGYEGLKQPWESVPNIVSSLRHHINLSRQLTLEYSQIDIKDPDQGPEAINGMIKKVSNDNPRLIMVGAQTYIERYRYCLASDNEKTRATGVTCREDWETTRNQQLRMLNSIGQAQEGMKVCERLRDMRTLAEMLWEDISYLEGEAREADDEQVIAHWEDLLEVSLHRMRHYFDKYKQPFADALYGVMVRTRYTGEMFEEPHGNKAMLTQYLRSQPQLAKVRWMNEILNEGKLREASDALLQAATTQETNAWGSQVEFSLAKLSLMAAEAEENSSAARAEYEFDRRLAYSSNKLRLLEVQNSLLNYLRPTIKGALDDNAAVDLVMAEHGSNFVGERPALREMLKRGFEEVIAKRALEPALLFDVLTLMDHTATEERKKEEGMELQNWLAFKALAFAKPIMDAVTWESCLRIVWKRTFLCDSWEEVNDTTEMADEAVQERLEVTVLFQVLQKGWETGFWHANPDMVVLRPADVLDAGCKASELEKRFPSEDLRDPIIKDNIRDDEELQQLLERSRLAHWVAEAKELAKKKIEGGREEVGKVAVIKERLLAEALLHTETPRLEDYNGVLPNDVLPSVEEDYDGEEDEEETEVDEDEGEDEDGEGEDETEEDEETSVEASEVNGESSEGMDESEG